MLSILLNNKVLTEKASILIRKISRMTSSARALYTSSTSRGLKLLFVTPSLAVVAILGESGKV
jgi:hypothetical protein